MQAVGYYFYDCFGSGICVSVQMFLFHGSSEVAVMIDSPFDDVFCHHRVLLDCVEDVADDSLHMWPVMKRFDMFSIQSLCNPTK